MSDRSDGGAVIWCPFADEEEAARISQIVVEERLVACANILGPIRSVFLWNGAVSEATECGVLFKTTTRALDDATARIAQLHSYDTPAVMGWHADSAPDAVREWLHQSVATEERDA